MNYRPIEIIIVDNGSTDGSFELIEQLVDRVKQNQDVAIRIVRLSKNYGFAVANMIAYRFRSLDAQYIALINDDMCPAQDSLQRLIEFLEKLSNKVAGVQGIMLTWDGRYVQSYGGYLTDHGAHGSIGAYMPISELSRDKLKPIPVGYLDGAYSIYRVEAIKKVGGLFLPYFFMWGDDYELGIRLWRAGFMLLAVPIIVGRHFAGATSREEKGVYEPPKIPYIYEYHMWRSNIAVTVLYSYPYPLQLLKRMPEAIIVSMFKKSKAIIRGFIDGMLLGITLRRRILKKMPWLNKLKEPRVYVRILHELAFLLRLYLQYRYRASKVYSIITKRALLKAAISARSGFFEQEASMRTPTKRAGRCGGEEISRGWATGFTAPDTSSFPEER